MAILVAGTYERFLFGYQLPAAQAELHAGELVKSFTYPAHQGPVRCVAGGGAYIVSGGQDDQLHIYDVRSGKDLGFLVNPGSGAVPCLEMFTPSGGAAATHMFSGSADGSIGVWRAGGGWEHLKQMKGHKGAVNDLSVHPSGRLALSVSHDVSLRMWDLMKGRATYTARLDAEGDAIAFTPSGESYALVCGSTVTIHNAAGEGGVLARLEHERRVTSMLPQQQDSTLLLGLEDGGFRLWDVRSGALQHSMEGAHGTRIRGLAVVTPDAGAPLPHRFASASSDGVIKLWDARMLPSTGRCQELASGATRARITCLCTTNPAASQQASPKPKAAAPGSKKRNKGQAQEGADVGSGAARGKQQQLLPTAAAPKAAGAKRKAPADQVEGMPARGKQDDVGTSGTRSVAKQKQLQLQAGGAATSTQAKAKAAAFAAAEEERPPGAAGQLSKRKRMAEAAAAAASTGADMQQQTGQKQRQAGAAVADPQRKEKGQLKVVAPASTASPLQHGHKRARKIAGLRKVRLPSSQPEQGDEALVPRVQTRILHKKNKKQRREEDMGGDHMYD